MCFTLIPFGLRQSDGQLVDVSTVTRGKQCGCICPSCHTSLVAKQGENREWHFAHASHGVYEQTNQACTFSFYVSACLMAKQLISTGYRLKLPEYRERVFSHAKPWQKQRSIEYTITREQDIELEVVEVEGSFNGIKIDILSKVKAFPFGIYFTYPGRRQPVDFKRFQEMPIGVIGIDLTDLKAQLIQERKSGNTYAAALANFLVSNIQSKHWIYHPRKQKRQAIAETHLAALLETEISLNRAPLNNQPSNQYTQVDLLQTTLQSKSQRARFECVICNVEWEGVKVGFNPCPRCGSHLFQRVKKEPRIKRIKCVGLDQKELA